MTERRHIPTDQATTRRVLTEPAFRAMFAGNGPNWLGHTRGSAAIDWDLIDGASMAQLLKHRETLRVVNNHLDHLEEKHGLSIDRSEILRFRRLPPEAIAGPTDTSDAQRTAATDDPSGSGNEVGDIAVDPEPADSRSGAGFGATLENIEVEQAAIQAVTRDFEGDGWLVRSVEQCHCGYDLECKRDDAVQHIEVKGVRGHALSFIMTRGEVERARLDPHFILIAVTDALSSSPTLHRYSGSDFVSMFNLTPIQFKATLKA